MTKKHFIFAADLIRLEIQEPHDKEVAADFFAEVAHHFNPAFDTERFFLSCGLDAEGKAVRQ